MQFLAGRLRHYFQASFEGIVGFDERQPRFAASEQIGKKSAEMRIDRIECRLQALTAFAVQAADRSAQPGNRRIKLDLFAGDQRGLVFQLFQLDIRTKIDRAKLFAVCHQRVISLRQCR